MTVLPTAAVLLQAHRGLFNLEYSLLLHYRFRQAAFRLRVETEMIASPSVPTQPAHPRSAYEGIGVQVPRGWSRANASSVEYFAGGSVSWR